MQKNIEENNYQDNPDETNIIYPSSSPTQGYQPRLNLEQAIEEGFTIRQQPTKGKAIGFTQQFGNFINPMLIIQSESEVPRYSNFICHARLRSADSGSDCSILRVGDISKDRLYCTLKGHRDVMGMALVDPVDGKQRLFFLFPDLSVRIAGNYQITVYIQNMADLSSPVSCVTTNAFTIFTSRRYPGRDEPTALTKSFCKIGAINLPRLGIGLGYKGAYREDFSVYQQNRSMTKSELEISPEQIDDNIIEDEDISGDGDRLNSISTEDYQGNA